MYKINCFKYQLILDTNFSSLFLISRNFPRPALHDTQILWSTKWFCLKKDYGDLRPESHVGERVP